MIGERYELQHELGAGGMGTVYRGLNTRTQQTVAIKQLRADVAQPENIERFKREGEALRDLNHPNIVRFREVYKTKKGKLCIVMDFADGGDLQGKIKEHYKNRDKNGGQLQYWSEDHVLNWFT